MRVAEIFLITLFFINHNIVVCNNDPKCKKSAQVLNLLFSQNLIIKDFLIFFILLDFNIHHKIFLF